MRIWSAAQGSRRSIKGLAQRSPGPQGGSIPLPSGHAAMRLCV
nr:MAG TPA: hypothetical protein [Caudoviricetes sp.]